MRRAACRYEESASQLASVNQAKNALELQVLRSGSLASQLSPRSRRMSLGSMASGISKRISLGPDVAAELRDGASDASARLQGVSEGGTKAEGSGPMSTPRASRFDSENHGNINLAPPALATPASQTTPQLGN